MNASRRMYVVALVIAVVVLVSSVAVTVVYAVGGGSGSPSDALSAGSWPGVGGMVVGRMGGRAASSCLVPNLPGSKVDVVVADMGAMMGGGRMMLRAAPSTVRAGEVSVVVRNQGMQTHEVVVLPLAGTTPAGSRVSGSDGSVDESGSVGEVSATCASGKGDGIASGATGWTTLTLAPGRYEIVCNEPGHYQSGMFQELNVVA